jgi:hypothetical protein
LIKILEKCHSQNRHFSHIIGHPTTLYECSKLSRPSSRRRCLTPDYPNRAGIFLVSLSHLFEILSPAGMSLVSLESLDWESAIFFSSSRHREMNMTTVLPWIGMFQIFSMICVLISDVFLSYLNSESNIPPNLVHWSLPVKSNQRFVIDYFSLTKPKNLRSQFVLSRLSIIAHVLEEVSCEIFVVALLHRSPFFSSSECQIHIAPVSI